MLLLMLVCMWQLFCSRSHQTMCLPLILVTNSVDGWWTTSDQCITQRYHFEKFEARLWLNFASLGVLKIQIASPRLANSFKNTCFFTHWQNFEAWRPQKFCGWHGKKLASNPLMLYTASDWFEENIDTEIGSQYYNINM